MPHPDAGYSTQHTLPPKRLPGSCSCGCNGGRGLKPLFRHDWITDDKGRKTWKSTGELRLDPESGQPMARYVILCKRDFQMLQDHQLALNAERAWRKERDERLKAERHTQTEE